MSQADDDNLKEIVDKLIVSQRSSEELNITARVLDSLAAKIRRCAPWELPNEEAEEVGR